MKKIFLLLIVLLNSLYAQYEESEFGLGAWIRSANIVYEHNNSVNSKTSNFIPLFYFDSKYIFLNGSEGGIKFYEDEALRFSVLTRLRFNDIPSDVQNSIQEDNFDFGFQARYTFNKEDKLYLELLNGSKITPYLNIRYETAYEFYDVSLKPSVQARLKSSQFNSYYYGINDQYQPDKISLNAGIEPSVALDLKYPLFKNLHLIARAEAKYIDDQARENPLVTSSHQEELYLGVAFFNDPTRPKKTSITNKEYIRIAYGYATPADLADISNLAAERDEHENTLASVFYGYPLSDELFSLPIDTYLIAGLAHHFSSNVQGSSTEGIMGIKFYYTIPLPFRIRLGLAEGLSYIDVPSYIEANELEEKGKNNSNLMNYLDMSVDLNLGDIFSDKLKNSWLGYSIHHRSSIFESSSQFGRIKGGSNYQTVYLQQHF